MKLILLISLLFTASVSYGQKDVSFNFNSTHSGRNVTASFSTTKNKNEFGFGIRYNINQLAHSDNQMNFYYKRLYSSNFIQHFGLTGFYQRKILTQWETISPFLFYDIQSSYSTTRNELYNPDLLPIDDQFIGFYKKSTEKFGPFGWIEQYIGIGFKAHLTGNFYLTQKIGAGTSFILGKEKKIANKNFEWFTFEFGGLINIGIIYRFN